MLSPAASNCGPRRPSRYNTMTWASRPAIVSRRKTPSDTRLAAQIAVAATAGRSQKKPSGRVAARLGSRTTKEASSQPEAATAASGPPELLGLWLTAAAIA